MYAGPGYRSDSVFNLSYMQPYSLSDILQPLQRLTEDVALYLPRTSDLRQLAGFANNDQKVTVMHYCIKGASKVCQTSCCGRRESVDNYRLSVPTLGGFHLSRSRHGLMLHVTASPPH